MMGRALLSASGVLAGIAVVASPNSGRLPGLPLTVCDVALVLAALCLLLRRAIQRERCVYPGRALVGPLAILGACAFSVASATNVSAAAKDAVQLALYLVVGTSVFRLLNGTSWRRALHRYLWTAIGVAFVLSAGAMIAPDAFAPLLPPWPTLVANLAVLACLAIALLPASARRANRVTASTVAAALSIAFAVLANVEPHASLGSAGELVPQQVREAYAALSVLADRPLLGVGLGNYQAHIGEYYQGMPKDNSMTPGTGAGYCILAASVGMVGLAAYLEWLRRVWRAAAVTRLRIPLLVLVGAGFFTPIFVGPVLLPMALIGGLAVSSARPREIRLVGAKRPSSALGGAAGVAIMLAFCVRPVPGEAFTFVWEAEGYAEIQAPMRVQDAVVEASARKAIELPLGCGQGWRGKGSGSVTYRVDLPHAGQYRLWARALWKDGCSNAVFLTANDGTRFVFGNDAVFNAWHWVKGQQLSLAKGINYLAFANHSDGIALDKFILTDDPFYVPEGLGDDVSQFFDGFAGCDADNTGSWEFPSGRWRVLRGAGEGAGGANDCLAQWDPDGGTALGGFPAWHDYDAKVRVMLPGAGSIGLVAFRQADGSGPRLECEVGESGARFRLLGREGRLAEVSSPGNHADRWIELGLCFEQGEVVGLIDGRPLLRAPYDGPPTGQIALFSKGSSGAYFDNVHVVFRR